MLYLEGIRDRHLCSVGVELALAMIVLLLALDGVCFGPRRGWWIVVFLSAWVWHTRTVHRVRPLLGPATLRMWRGCWQCVGLLLFIVLIGMR